MLLILKIYLLNIQQLLNAQILAVLMDNNSIRLIVFATVMRAFLGLFVIKLIVQLQTMEMLVEVELERVFRILKKELAHGFVVNLFSIFYNFF